MKFLIRVLILLKCSFKASKALVSSPVSVKVQTPLTASPQDAALAWLDYVFTRGGGLPVYIYTDSKDCYDYDDLSSSGIHLADRRTLVPLFAQETIVLKHLEDKKECVIQYALTELGPLWQSQIQEGSHLGEVKFTIMDKTKMVDSDLPNDTSRRSCIMTWKCEFDTKQNDTLWEFITKFNLKTASENLAAYLAPYQLYTRKTNLGNVSLDSAMDEWLSFIFNEGGGLPFPPPIRLMDKPGEKSRVQIPPFLIEKVTSIDRDSSQIYYKVANPGRLTYQVYKHKGKVKFIKNNDNVEMVWSVEILPMSGYESIVKIFTSMVISTLCRNLKIHLKEPNALVDVLPPRGGGGEKLISIRKDSWLGGVMDVHISDDRPVLDQTVALLKPWTWGRISDEKGESESWIERDRIN